MNHNLKNLCQESMQERINLLIKSFKRIRTGRASTVFLDGIRVDYYGTPTPLDQIATLSTPDARTILVSPFDKTMIPSIEKAIMIADIGEQPNNDSNVIRIPISPLTKQKREEIIKKLRKMGEESKVYIRQIRRNYNDQIKKLEKEKEFSEDEGQKLQKDIQAITNEYIDLVDQNILKKEQDIKSL